MPLLEHFFQRNFTFKFRLNQPYGQNRLRRHRLWFHYWRHGLYRKYSCRWFYYFFRRRQRLRYWYRLNSIYRCRFNFIYRFYILHNRWCRSRHRLRVRCHGLRLLLSDQSKNLFIFRFTISSRFNRRFFIAQYPYASDKQRYCKQMFHFTPPFSAISKPFSNSSQRRKSYHSNELSDPRPTLVTANRRGKRVLM